METHENEWRWWRWVKVRQEFVGFCDLCSWWQDLAWHDKKYGK